MIGQDLKFTVAGQPEGKARPRVCKTHTYTPAKTVRYERKVIEAAQKAMKEQGWTNSDSPLGIYIQAFYKLPVSKPKRFKEQALAGQVFPTVKPDYDNIIKIISDALNKVAYEDDKQIIDAKFVKKYAEVPRVEVILFRI